MSDDPTLEFANALLADGRRDREVLRRRWHVPTWSADVEEIATVLGRYPLLVPLVQKTIDDELAQLATAIEHPTPATESQEATPDADRQDAPVPDV